MKLMLFFISSLVLIPSLHAEISANSISEIEENKVLLLLNNFCGDSWCEGAYEIDFKAIEFTPTNEIYILAAATPADSQYDTKNNAVVLHCQVSEPSVITDTLNAEENEQKYEAEQRLYEVVSDCIDTALYSKPI